jgi:Putative transposase, YhgA-like
MQKTEFAPETATQKSTKHDDFVRGACMQTFIVEPLLRHFVEPELSDKFDYKTLKLCQDSYITPELANYYTDRLWSVDFKNSQAVLQLLLLVEHKSFVPKRIHIQVLRYMIEEWTKQINAQLEALQEMAKNGKKNRQKIKLILILPIVLYHGKSVWTLPKFEDLFGHLPDILKRFLPDFDIIVI